jgi:hypothetical protein
MQNFIDDIIMYNGTVSLAQSNSLSLPELWASVGVFWLWIVPYVLDEALLSRDRVFFVLILSSSCRFVRTWNFLIQFGILFNCNVILKCCPAMRLKDYIDSTVPCRFVKKGFHRIS